MDGVVISKTIMSLLKKTPLASNITKALEEETLDKLKDVLNDVLKSKEERELYTGLSINHLFEMDEKYYLSQISDNLSNIEKRLTEIANYMSYLVD